MEAGGAPHPSAFERAGPGARTATVRSNGQSSAVTAGVADLARYEDHVLPLLFRLSAERAHALAQAVLRLPIAGTLVCAQGPRDPALACSLAGIACASPIGLAPAFDKDGRLIRALERFCFGYLMAGSTTPTGAPDVPHLSPAPRCRAE